MNDPFLGRGACVLGERMPGRVGVVLAGGVGQRLGRPKGELIIRGAALALRAARVLEPLCGEVVISLRPGAVNPAGPYREVRDAEPAGRGPLAGLQAAWNATPAGTDLLVLACDYPRVEQSLLRVLCDAALPESDVVLFTDGTGRDHPLVALWRWPARTGVEAVLVCGSSRVGAVLDRVRVARLRAGDYPSLALDALLLNVNTPGELAELDEPP